METLENKDHIEQKPENQHEDASLTSEQNELQKADDVEASLLIDGSKPINLEDVEHFQETNDEISAPPTYNLEEAKKLKEEANQEYKDGMIENALRLYHEAITICPLEETKDLAIFHNNRGICFSKINKNKEAKEEFSKAIELQSDYVKPRYQKLLILKEEEEYELALEEAKKVKELDPSFPGINGQISALEKMQKEKFDKMKDEVMGNLKGLGNMILGKFGMNLDSFKLNQNQDGTYNKNQKKQKHGSLPKQAPSQEGSSNLYEKLKSDDQSKQENVLMTLASISLTPDMPLHLFYSQGIISIVMINEFRNDFSNPSNSELAREQIFIICSRQYKEIVASIIQTGYIGQIHQIIEKAINLLEYESKQASPNLQNQELYKLVLEQSYSNLEEFVHFVEEGNNLKEFTNSEQVKQSLKLILNCQQMPYLSVRIFTRISAFLKELSIDNATCHVLHSQEFDQFVQNFLQVLNSENSEFVTNLLVLLMNMLISKGGVPLVQARFDIFKFAFDNILSQESPQKMFMNNFAQNYKLADLKAQDKEIENEQEKEEEDDTVEMEDDDQVAQAKEDKVIASMEFKQWKSMCKANVNVMFILQELITGKGDNDEDNEFEDVNSDEDEKIENEQIVDLDSVKQFGVNVLCRDSQYLAQVVLRCAAIPQYLGLPLEAEENLDEVQEAAYGLVSDLYQHSKQHIPKEILCQVCQFIREMIETNLYKCERTSFGSALSFLHDLTEESEEVKNFIRTHMVNSIIKLGNYVQNTETIALAIQILSLVLNAQTKQAFASPQQIEIVCEILVNACKSGDLLLISYALNGFYDIFSEADYNKILVEGSVIPLMEQGSQQLEILYKQSKKEKSLSKRELGYVEDALQNLPRFVDYKKQEFKKQ